MKRFPFANDAALLTGDDLHRLAVPFARSVNHFFPGTAVAFVGLDGIESLAAEQASLGEGLKSVRDRGRAAVSADGSTLLLPMWRDEEVIGAAILSNSELPFVDMSTSWLLEVSRILSREFRQLKQWSVDGATSLPNGQQLRAALAAVLAGGAAEGGQLRLVLIEIFPRAKDGEQAVAQFARAAGSLEGMVGHVAPLYACGAGVFGTLWPEGDSAQGLKMGEAVLRKLKRENFPRVHIGIAALGQGEEETAALLLDRAWEALHAARRRGPHALCTYEALTRLQDHPFSPPPGAVMAQLRRRWRGLDRFALVLLHQDQATSGEPFSQRIVSLLGPGVPLVVLNGGEAYALLAHADEAGALAWAEEVRRKIGKVKGLGFSMGIALYPGGPFGKSAQAVNARKALRHASFFGAGAVALFDAVSLNISGDVYYNDGDLARAVREYRQGLALAPDSVNLLNSLGVVYVQMNRYREAIPLFEQAAILDSSDFMAPINLAFAYLEQGRAEAATAAFEKALAIDGNHGEALLQLGRLYCRQERYGEAVPLLERAVVIHGGASPNGAAAALQLALAEAYRGLGHNREAIVCLERAARLDPRDAAILSLLGELYAEAGQGDEIALSLCRQAVELDDGKWQPWYRLGVVQLRLGDGGAALASLKQGLRFDRHNLDILMLLGRVYAQAGQVRQARRMYERVLRLRPDHGKAAPALAELAGEQ
ncbi:MAG: tetratricopeptide repeat protein [Desulfobulbaceae bacterium]|nr:tetratricopeptide repeat protein [Desulfobulbaceae bacterium]